MTDQKQPSKAARIVAAIFKPQPSNAVTDIPSTDEPEDRDSTKKSFLSRASQAIFKRMSK